MNEPADPTQSRYPYVLVGAFGAVAAVFVVAAIFTLSSVLEIDQEVVDLESNSLPSVARLSSVGGDLQHLEGAVDGLSRSPPAARAPMLDTASRAHRAIEADLQSYATTGWYPGERELFDQQLRPKMARLDADLADLERAVAAPEGPTVELERRTHNDADAVEEVVSELLDLNHVQSFAAAERILRARQRSVRLAVVLEAVCSIVALFAGWLAVRTEGRARQVMRRHSELQAVRASELETFAQRIAHDLLSPLTATAFSLGTLARRHPDEETVRLITRIREALDRSRRMVRGIFDFARAGARPLVGRRAMLGPVLSATVEDVLAAEPQPSTASIEVEPFEDVEVACDEAVLSVIVLNLLGNAVKYTRESPVRQIQVHVTTAAGRVRVEVQDSGPGLAAGLERAVFEPYFRAPEANQPGLGLGLATVHRFVTSHGGSVGVRRLEAGSAFWFELPVAEARRSFDQLPAARPET